MSVRGYALLAVAGFCALGYALTGCGAAHYGMTSCPHPALVGKAARATDLKLLPGSAPWTCTYIPADRYQRWVHGSHHALSVDIYLFPRKLASSRLLDTVDGRAALRRHAATIAGHIMVAGNEAPVARFRTGYGAWTGQRLSNGSYAVLAIYLSSGQAPRTAAEFLSELQAMAQVSGLA